MIDLDENILDLLKYLNQKKKIFMKIILRYRKLLSDI